MKALARFAFLAIAVLFVVPSAHATPNVSSREREIALQFLDETMTNFSLKQQIGAWLKNENEDRAERGVPQLSAISTQNLTVVPLFVSKVGMITDPVGGYTAGSCLQNGYVGSTAHLCNEIVRVKEFVVIVTIPGRLADASIVYAVHKAGDGQMHISQMERGSNLNPSH